MSTARRHEVNHAPPKKKKPATVEERIEGLEKIVGLLLTQLRSHGIHIPIEAVEFPAEKGDAETE